MKKIVNFKLLIILLHTSTTQFVNYPPQGMQNYFPYQQHLNGINNYNSGRRSFRRIGRTVPLLSDSDYSEYTDSFEKCTCSCNQCYKPKSCCISTCQSCRAGMVIVPYPVPILMRKITRVPHTTVTTTKTTTIPTLRLPTSSVPTSTVPTSTVITSTVPTSIVTTMTVTKTPEKNTKSTQVNFYNTIPEETWSTSVPKTYTATRKRRKCPLISGVCVPKKHKTTSVLEKKIGKISFGNRILMRPTLAYPHKNPVKAPAWVPKFGILPIPDNVAVKLLSQLQDISSFRLENSSELENSQRFISLESNSS